MKHAEYEGGEYVRERTLPTWSLDEASRELIRQALVFLARRPERLTPYHAPLDDLPDTARPLDGRWSDLDVTSRQGFASSAGAHPTRRPQGPTRIVIDDRFVGRALSEDEMAPIAYVWSPRTAVALVARDGARRGRSHRGP
jgi:hypothetical protein